MSNEHRYGLLESGWSIVGALLIIAGLISLGGRALGVDVHRLAWPMFVIWPGILTCGVAMISAVRSGVAIMSIGSALTMIGFVLQYQAIIDRFESWADVWALIPAAISLGLLIYGRLKTRPDLTVPARQVMVISIIIGIVGAVFFEGVIGLIGLPNQLTH